MAFKFLHTADWHIGKPFGNFEPEQQSILRRARLGAIDRLAEAAQVSGVEHIVVCGDIFDGPGLADDVLLATIARLAAYGRLTWHLLPGNHDSGHRDGIWPRFTKLGLPKNVKLLLTPVPIEIAPGAFLLPAPVESRAVSNDLTSWMDQALTPPAAIRIGVAHGSTKGFGSDGAASISISAQRRSSARLDYMALGDWHGVSEIAPGVWYSGTPEPDHFPDNEPGHALIVELSAGGATPHVQKIATASHVWKKRLYAITRADDLIELETEIANLGPAKSNVLLELVLTGTVALEADADIRARLDALAPGLFHLRRRLEGLKLDTGFNDLAAISDPQLKSVAERLIGLRDSDTEREIAEGALRRLLTLSRQADGAAQ